MKKTMKILLNLAIVLVVIGFAVYMAVGVGNEESTTQQGGATRGGSALTPWIELTDEVNGFVVKEGTYFIAAGQSLYLYNKEKQTVDSFAIAAGVRDVAVEGNDIYLLYPTSVSVYSHKGEVVREWPACSDQSDYCSLALAGGFLYATDAANKNICQYTTEGNFVTFISSPDQFIIPSYAFDIAAWNDTLYVANSGRHKVELYTLSGQFISSFGSTGTEPGAFAGCCNPVHIAFSPEGHLLTSEKGTPRIHRYTRDGQFMEVVVPTKQLGSGTQAFDLQIDSCGLPVLARQHNLYTVQPNGAVAGTSACETCTANCPLRKGVTL